MSFAADKNFSFPVALLKITERKTYQLAAEKVNSTEELTSIKKESLKAFRFTTPDVVTGSEGIITYSTNSFFSINLDQLFLKQYKEMIVFEELCKIYQSM